MKARLNLGCGRLKRDDCCNVDVRSEVSPDVQWNLDVYPYPLPRDHFEHVYATDVIEHLADVAHFMEEVHGLLSKDGILEITTPHFSCNNSFMDPTHKQHLGCFSFDFFTPQSDQDFSSSASFEIVQRTLVFRPGFVNRFVGRLANRFPDVWEQNFCWMLPAWFMIFKLRALK